MGHPLTHQIYKKQLEKKPRNLHRHAHTQFLDKTLGAYIYMHIHTHTQFLGKTLGAYIYAHIHTHTHTHTYIHIV